MQRRYRTRWTESAALSGSRRTARNTRTDRSHPANHLRIALIEARPQLPGVLELSEDEWAAIDAELAPGYAGAARGLPSS